MKTVCICFLVFLVWTMPAFALLNEKGQPMSKEEEVALYEKYRKLNLDLDRKVPEHLLSTFGYIKAAGGDVSGGGSTIRVAGGDRYLLDFAMLNPTYRDSREVLSSEEPLHSESWTPEEIVNGALIDLKRAMPRSYSLYEERLSLWEKNSPILVQAIRQIVQNTPWRVTPLSIGHVDEFQLPKGVNRSDVTLGRVSLVLKGYGVFVSNWAWLRPLGLTSRAGLIVHEALRTIRVEISERLSNETLQLLTAHLMLTDPSTVAVGYLDEIFLHGMWAENPWTTQRFERKADYVEALCERGDAIVDLSRKVESTSAEIPGWTDAAARDKLAEIDRQVRSKDAIRSVLGPVPPVEANKPLAEIPQRSLSFWLDHINEVARFQHQKTFPLGIVPSIPAAYFEHNASLMVRPFWRLLRQRVEEYRAKACGSNPDADSMENFILAANTAFGRGANSFVTIDKYTFYRNFEHHGFIQGRPDLNALSKYIDDVIQDMMGAKTCHFDAFNSDVTVLGDGGFPGASDCKPVPKAYFLNGVPPLPRIGSK